MFMFQVLVKEQDGYEMQNILPVSFASLVVPSGAEAKNNSVQLPMKQVQTLKSLVRVAIRKHIQRLIFPEDVIKVKPSPLTRSEKAKRSQMSMRESFMRVRGRLRNRPDPGTNQNGDRRPNRPDSNNEGELAVSEMEPLLRPESNSGTVSNENRETSIAYTAAVSTENASQVSDGIPNATSPDETQASAESSSDCLAHDSSVLQPSASKKKSCAISNSSTIPDGDGESSNDSLDKNFKLFTVENGKSSNCVYNVQGTSSGGNIATSEGSQACNTRDASADSQDGRPIEPKRIRIAPENVVTNQSAAPETSNSNADDQTSSNSESFSPNSVPDVTVQSAHGDDSCNVETHTSASTYDLEIDEISE